MTGGRREARVAGARHRAHPVLRRCRLIVSTDAGADPNYECGDLGNAVRKIRIDLGIPIEFRDLPIRRYAGKEDAAARIMP